MDSNNSPDFVVKEVKQTPYWQSLHNSLTDDLKNNKWIKNSYKRSFKELREILSKGMYWCDDCGKEIKLELPKSFSRLTDLICYFFNEAVCSQCYECEIKMIKSGQVLGTVEDGWHPDKNELLKKTQDKHSSMEIGHEN